MLRAILIIAATLALGACATTRDANEAMSRRFVGAPVDSFFLSYGPPAASHRLNDGRQMYLWAESPQTLHLPGYTNTQVNVVGNTAWVTGWTSPGSTVEMQCQVRIVVNRQGRIERILSHSDTTGWWQLSRCAEIFI